MDQREKEGKLLVKMDYNIDRKNSYQGQGQSYSQGHGYGWGHFRGKLYEQKEVPMTAISGQLSHLYQQSHWHL